MIKVNLLENHFSTPLTREKTSDTDTSASKVINVEAKKSQKRLVYMTATLLALIAGTVMLFSNRYEVVAWVEQYTGPLNLLAPPEDIEASALAAEEARQEKIRQLYMYNTLVMQDIYRRFLVRVDSINDARAERVYVKGMDLEESNFNVEMFGKANKDVADFTTSFMESKLLEETKTLAIKPSSLIAGFPFTRTLSGTLKIESSSSDAELAKLKITYLDVDRAKKKLLDLARSDSLKVAVEGKMTSSKGVVMTTHAGDFKMEGRLENFLKFLRQVNDMHINFEVTEIEINYAAYSKKKSSDKKKLTDNIILKFNILTPNSGSDSKPVVPKTN